MLGKQSINVICRTGVGCAVTVALLVGCRALKQNSAAEWVQVGEMHVAIGNGQHHGRVRLDDITGKPHFFGIGAVEALRGEITILNSVAVATAVAQDGRPRPLDISTVSATILVGASVRNWISRTFADDISYEKFGEAIGTMAAENGIDGLKPFVFVIEGEFRDVRLHIINGACPIHARRNGFRIETQKQPFVLEVAQINGTLVGVYATDAAGTLTHPGTHTHSHLIYIDEESGERVTGHIEQVGLAKSVIVKLPEPGAAPAASDVDTRR